MKKKKCIDETSYIKYATKDGVGWGGKGKLREETASLCRQSKFNMGSRPRYKEYAVVWMAREGWKLKG